MPDPDQGIFINSDLTPMGEGLLRQGLELAVRLEIARHAQVLPGTSTPDSVLVLLNTATANSLEARRKLDLTVRPGCQRDPG